MFIEVKIKKNNVNDKCKKYMVRNRHRNGN